AAVVERHIQPAEGLHRSLDHCGDLGLVGHVADDPEGLVTRVLEVLLHRGERGCIDVPEDDSCAGLRKLLSCCQAHTRAGTRYQRDLAGEIVGRIQWRSYSSAGLEPEVDDLLIR